MFDTELALDTLSQIKDTLSMIMARTSHIHKVDDFYMNESGMILLDSVCMKLVAVGEAIKNLDKITNKELLLKYPAVNWKDIKGMRDIIVHHYFDIDASVILYSLQKEVPDLYSTICVMLRFTGGMGVVCVLVFIPSKSENNKRIAKNTLFLYVRMLFIMESNFCIKHNSL